MRLRSLHVAALLGAALACTGTGFAGTGVLLPVQDRPGEPALAGVVEDTVRVRLSRTQRLADKTAVRDAMRRLRLRSADYASPGLVGELAEHLDADWILVVTLHDIRTRPVPAVILSARAVDPRSDEMPWVGFHAASGLDDRLLLGRGVIESLPELLERTAARLVDDFLAPDAKQPTPPRRSTDAYVSQDRGDLRGGRFAVATFDSLTEDDALVRAEIATVAALAVLHRRGFTVLRPDRVNEILRHRQVPVAGEVDGTTRAALSDRLGVDYIVTGTVVGWKIAGTGEEPEPLLEISAQLIAAATGRILGIDGQERGGWDRHRGVGTNRTFAAGRLAQEMLDEMISEFTRAQKGSG